MGLLGEWAPKSMLPRLLKLCWSLWVLVVDVVLVETMEFVRAGALGSWATGGDFAMGKDMPRSFPRLATPTPHVKVVLYPEHSFPISTHCPQYGRRRSHFIWRFLHAKQSSVAPVAGALLLRFLGAAAAAALLVVVVAVVVVMGVISTFLTSAGWVVGETAMLGSIKDVM